LDAFLKVPRHLFIPEALRKDAYADFPVPIGEGQTISQPYIVALMTEILELKSHQRVLEIGTGSGYQTAILAELVKEVYSIERVASLADHAATLLRDLGVHTVEIKAGDGALGWPQKAPFDAIMITAAAPEVPASLIAQLKESGRLVAPLGQQHTSQVLTLCQKKGAQLYSKDICGCVFVPLISKLG
jgi:protein-L-isoaspartate(D-aspartate) O-methyltransferase